MIYICMGNLLNRRVKATVVLTVPPPTIVLEQSIYDIETQKGMLLSLTNYDVNVLKKLTDEFSLFNFVIKCEKNDYFTIQLIVRYKKKIIVNLFIKIKLKVDNPTYYDALFIDTGRNDDKQIIN